MQLTRTRAFAAFTAGIAVTAASAITFNAFTVGALGDDESTFVPINPCRLFDTRPGSDNVGDRNTPLGAAESDTFQVTGTNGECTIPADATGVAMNVTAADMTASSFLTIWPEGETRPLASSLNFVGNQPPTPNKVDVRLGAGGAIEIYNLTGTVNVLADVVGYYTNSGLQGLQAEIDELRAAQMLVGVSPQPDSVVVPAAGVGQPITPIPVAIAGAGEASSDGVAVLEGTLNPGASAGTHTCWVNSAGVNSDTVMSQPSDDDTLTIRLRVDVTEGDAIGGSMICSATHPNVNPPVLPAPVEQPLLTVTFTPST